MMCSDSFSIRSLAIGACFFLPMGLFGQDTLSLEEAMKMAVEENHSVKVARDQRTIAKNAHHIGNAGLLPRVEVRSSGDYSRQNTTQEFAGGIPDSEIQGAESRSANASINLDYTLFDGMSRIREYKKLEAEKELGKLQARNRTENVLMDLIRAFYEVARSQGQRSIALENVGLSNERVERAERQNDYGKASKVDVLNARVDLDSDSSTFLQADLDLERAKRNLNVLMGREPKMEFVVEDDVDLARDLAKDSLIAKGMERNARLVQARKDRNIAELDRKIAASGNYPDLSLNGSYSYSRNQSDAGILNLNESDGLSAGFRFSYPIFQGFQQDIQEKNARIRVESRKEELAEIEKQVRRDLLNAWESYRMRLKMLRMEERGVHTARKNFERSRESYRVGRIDATRLREAQLTLIEARIRKLNSKFQAKTAEMELLKLAGGLNEKVDLE